MAIDSGSSNEVRSAAGTAFSRFEHPALFYDDDRDYAATVTRYIQAGLAGGEPVMVAVPSAKLEILRESLGADAERIAMHNMVVKGRNPGRIIADVLLAFAAAHRDQRVRVVGEPIWRGRSAIEYPACVQHEALINTAFRGVAATILCPYDRSALDKSVLDDARRTHPVLWMDGRRTASSDYWDPIAAAEDFNLPLPAAPPGSSYRVFDIHQLVDVREVVGKEAESVGIDPVRIDDVVLAANELATNTCRHAPGGHGALSTWIEHDQFVLDVSDGGYIRDPLAGRRPAAPDQLGGRGLLLVNRLADLVRLHTGPRGTSVRVYFDLR
jgi:anti-sigma regulatory factor (Ser/Thr protein kinase)